RSSPGGEPNAAGRVCPDGPQGIARQPNREGRPMLLELAVGDAYGAGFEYTTSDVVRRHNTLADYIQHPRHDGIQPGMYTDDTQMSLAVAEAVVSGERWTPENIAARFVTAFQRDPRDGYARGFQAFLETVRDGRDFLARIRPDSEKSG